MMKMMKSALLAFVLVVRLDAEPMRVTRDRADEFRPRWSPAGETIAYVTNREPGRARAIAAVEADGTKERLVAVGMQEGFGLCGDSRVEWVGATGKLVTGETSHFHEFLEFSPGEKCLKREILDDSDEYFTVKMVADGGGGSNCLGVSRDGQFLLWRYSSIGANGDVSLRIAPYAELLGQKSSTVGAVILSEKGTGLGGTLFYDCAIGPEGKFIVVSQANSAGHDLFLYDVARAGKPVQLTKSGEEKGTHNTQAGFSPDGKWIAFTTRSGIDGTRNGEVVTAKSDLAILEVATLKVTPLTWTPLLGESSPSWSPDGKRIVFQRQDSREAGTVEPGEPDNINLYVMAVP